MFRRQLTPKTVGIVTLILLAAIQAVYWRLLVYREPVNAPPGGPGGGAVPFVTTAVGLEEVDVRTWIGSEPGYRDGAAWEARFSGPSALALERDGSLLVADSRNHRIRRISETGRVTTVAGGAEPGGPGGRSDGPAAQAELRFPGGVAAAPDGMIYVADTGNHRICRIRDGQLTTLAGGATPGKADGAGPAARFRLPAALALDPSGALWVADVGNRAARRVEPSGRVTTPAAVPEAAQKALGTIGEGQESAPILAANEGRGAPGPTIFRTGRRSPAVNGMPSLYLYADPEYHVVMARTGSGPDLLVAGRRLDDTPNVRTDDGTGVRAGFALPCALVAKADGTIYVAEFEGNCIRRIRLPGWLAAGAAPDLPRAARARWNRRATGGS